MQTVVPKADKRKYTIKYGFTDIKKIFKNTFGRESKEFLYIFRLRGVPESRRFRKPRHQPAKYDRERRENDELYRQKERSLDDIFERV